MNTSEKLILASGSEIRQTLLRNAGVSFDVNIGRIDEESVKDALLGEGASPRDIADALAEGKARKVSLKNLDAMVIGCDQTLSFKGRLLSKPKTVDEARGTAQASLCGGDIRERRAEMAACRGGSA